MAVRPELGVPRNRSPNIAFDIITNTCTHLAPTSWSCGLGVAAILIPSITVLEVVESLRCGF